MKKLILILTLTILMSCTLDYNTNLNSQLLGKWQWIESSGGIDGRIENYQTTGIEKTIEISSNKIKTFVNGILVSESVYEIQQGESIITYEKAALIVYENGRKQSIKLNENNLILFDECYDCYQNVYIKE